MGFIETSDINKAHDGSGKAATAQPEQSTAH